MLEKPNLFIVGAPKSGTTSLYEYLNLHPEVGMSSVKEPCYFASDFQSTKYPDSEEKYLSLFESDSSLRYLGEGSTTYLYSTKAAQEIADYCPNAKIIMMLRQPTDLAVSLHAQRLKEGDETIPDCEDAIKAEVKRANGDEVPANFHYPKEYLLYSEVPLYAEQIQRYLARFPRGAIHVVLFEKFKDSPQREFLKICRFLCIDPPIDLDLVHHNPGRIPKNIRLHRLLKKVVPYVVRFEKSTEAIFPKYINDKFRALLRFGYGFNMSKGVKKVSDDFRSSLDEKYKQNILDIKQLLGAELANDVDKYWR